MELLKRGEALVLEVGILLLLRFALHSIEDRILLDAAEEESSLYPIKSLRCVRNDFLRYLGIDRLYQLPEQPTFDGFQSHRELFVSLLGFVVSHYHGRPAGVEPRPSGSAHHLEQSSGVDSYVANTGSPPHAGALDDHQVSWEVHSHRQSRGGAESRYHPTAKGLLHETPILRVHPGMVIRHTSEETSLQGGKAGLVGNIAKLRVNLRRRSVAARQVCRKLLCIPLGMAKYDGGPPIGELTENGWNLLAHPLIEEILVLSRVALARHMDGQRHGAVRRVEDICLVSFHKSRNISNVGQRRRDSHDAHL